jgi:hypothetical protein
MGNLDVEIWISDFKGRRTGRVRGSISFSFVRRIGLGVEPSRGAERTGRKRNEKEGGGQLPEWL